MFAKKQNIHHTIHFFLTMQGVFIGEWRILHNKELHDLYSSPSIIRIIKLRMRWEGHVARWGIRGTPIDNWWKSQRERATRKTKT
jgi:hypothetical protein